MSELHEYTFIAIGKDGSIASEKKIRIMKECIEAGVDINYDNSKVLAFAVNNNDTKIIKFLIENGISLNNGTHLLRTACQTNNLEIVKLLLSMGVETNPKENPPILQCRSIEIIKLLIEHGADPHVESDKLLFYCCFCDNTLHVVEYLLSIGLKCSDYAIITAFYALNKTKNFGIKKLLLENGANPNANVIGEGCDINLLEMTVIDSDLDSCKLLLQYNADVNLCHNLINKNYNIINKKKKTIVANIKLITELFAEHGLDISEFADKMIK